MGSTTSINQNQKLVIDHDMIDQAILDLKVTLNKLKKYQQQQERCQEIELEKARKLVKEGQKEYAKIILRQKKAREIFINKAEHMIEGLESQINAIQNMQIEINVIENIKQNNQILKYMNDLMPIEEVERIMNENQEQTDHLKEINGFLSQNTNRELNQFDDEYFDKLLEELDIDEQKHGGNLVDVKTKSQKQDILEKKIESIAH